LGIGAVLGSLVLALGALAAVYVAKPEMFGRTPEPAANANAEKKTILVQVPADNANLTQANANTNGAVVAENPPNANVPPEAKRPETVAKTETKQTDTKSKTEPVAPNKKNNALPTDEPPDITVDDDNDDDSGAPPTDPKTKRKFPVFVWRQMSPADKQKLRDALELQRQQQEIERQRRQQEMQRRIPRPPVTPQN
jgi:hypothetical protein